jgi:hypothetical protein
MGRRTLALTLGIAALWTLLLKAQGQEQAPGRVSEREILQLLRRGVVPVRVATIIEGRGIEFEFTPEIEKSLVKQGVPEPVLASLRKQKPAFKREDLPKDAAISAEAAAFSPDGKWLALASGRRDQVQLWTLPKWSALPTFPIHVGNIAGVDFSSDSKELFVQGNIRIEVLELSGFPLRNLPSDTTVSVSADAGAAATGYYGAFNVIDIRTGAQRGTGAGPKAYGDPEQVYSLAFTSDGKILASGHSSAVRLWEISAAGLRQLREFALGASVLAFSADGGLLACGMGGANGAAVWDVKSGKLVAKVHPSNTVTSVAFSPDGKWLVTGTDLTDIRLWEVDGWRLRQALYTGTTIGEVRDVAFSPDARWVVTAISSWSPMLWRSTEPLKGPAAPAPALSAAEAAKVASLVKTGHEAASAGKYEAAISAFRRALAVDPANRGAREGLQQAVRAKAAEADLAKP